MIKNYFELEEKQYKTLGGTLKRGMVGYGYLPLMRMRACPLKQGKNCGSCKGKGLLKDRKGIEFLVSCENKEYTTLFNSVPLYLGDKPCHTDYWMLQFTTESPEECKKITSMVLNKEKADFKRTCALFERTLL